jgi:hypothetical protein
MQDLNDNNDSHWSETAINWLVGPCKLGQNIGLAISAFVLIAHYYICPPTWSVRFLYKVFFGLASGFVGAGIASLAARDAYLSSRWTRFRLLISLIVGASIGTIVGLLFADIWIGIAGSVGGAIGGAIDAFVHRKTLED